MAWPTPPKTWTPGEIVDDATLNTEIRDRMNYLWSEGSWTPIVTGLGGATGVTYTQQNGKWFKLGGIVCAFGRVQLANKGTITGVVLIAGLPFTAQTSPQDNVGALSMVFFSGLGTNWTHLAGIVNSGGTWATLTGTQAAATQMINLTSTDL